MELSRRFDQSSDRKAGAGIDIASKGGDSLSRKHSYSANCTHLPRVVAQDKSWGGKSGDPLLWGLKNLGSISFLTSLS